MSYGLGGVGGPVRALVGYGGMHPMNRGSVGASQIIGKAQEIIGQLDQLEPGVRQAVEKSIMSRNTWGITERDFDKARILVLGINIAAVANGGTGNALARPQYPFRTCRFVVPSTIAPGWRINNIAVGQQPVLAAAGGFPSEAFSEVAVDVGVIWPTASIGNEISIDVLNRTGAQADFEAMLLGICGVD